MYLSTYKYCTGTRTVRVLQYVCKVTMPVLSTGILYSYKYCMSRHCMWPVFEYGVPVSTVPVLSTVRLMSTVLSTIVRVRVGVRVTRINVEQQ